MIETLTLYNEKLNEEIVVSEKSNDYVLISADFGTIAGDRNVYNAVGQDGVYIADIRFEVREPVITGYIVAPDYTILEQRKDRMNRLIHPKQTIEVKCYGDYRISGVPQTTVRYGVSWAENNNIMCKFMINLYCADPFFYEQSNREQVLAVWQPWFHFPLVIPQNEGTQFGRKSIALIGTVENYGDEEVGMIITFTANSAISNPYLLNLETQERLRLVYNMSAGDKIVVDTRFNQKTIELLSPLTDLFNTFDYPDSVFLQLHTGQNLLRYGADSNEEGLQVSVRYDPKRMEVE